MIGEPAVFWSSLAGAFTCAVAGAWLYQRGDDRPGRDVTLLALGMSALWGVVTAATGSDSTASALAETVRNLAWLAFLHQLITGDRADSGMAGVRPVLAVLACVELLHPVKLSADGVPFLLHDATLERTSDGQGIAGAQGW